jgi:hypothetical protein
MPDQKTSGMTKKTIFVTSLTRKYPSLVKRGKGRFYGECIILKIPLNPPFPKGECIMGIFMFHCDSEAHVDSRGSSRESIFSKKDSWISSANVCGRFMEMTDKDRLKKVDALLYRFIEIEGRNS